MALTVGEILNMEEFREYRVLCGKKGLGREVSHRHSDGHPPTFRTGCAAERLSFPPAFCYSSCRRMSGSN